MFLRMIVSQFVREAAEKKLRGVVDEAAQRRQAEEEGPPAEVPPCDVMVVFALGIESGSFVDKLEESASLRCRSFVEHAGQFEGRRVVIIETGVGRPAAARAVDDAIAIHRPAWVVSAGFAAGLRDELQRGHIVMADQVVDAGGNELSVGLKIDPAAIAATRGLHLGRLVTVDHIVRTTREKRDLGAQFNAVACDMETSAVAEVCCSAKVRFLSVRVISDAVDDELPKEVERLLAQGTLAGKLGAAARAVVGRPSSVKDMWKLRDDAFRAAERLAAYLASMLPQLD